MIGSAVEGGALSRAGHERASRCCRACWLPEALRRGLRQAIASAAPRLNVEAIVAALSLAVYFESAISCRDDIIAAS